MEDNTSVMSRRKTTSNDDETPEESSWTMYFEDFFSEVDTNIQTDDDCRSDHHDNTSMISDAASFVGMKKIIVRDDEQSSSKKRRGREASVAAHDLEDTASSPSRSPNVHSMMNLLGNNSRHEGEGVGSDTDNEKGKISGQDGVGLSIDLKKKGLCLVPLSMVADYLG